MWLFSTSLPPQLDQMLEHCREKEWFQYLTILLLKLPKSVGLVLGIIQLQRVRDIIAFVFKF